jgi:phosphoglycerate dehydrogenase-like enzyme
VVNVGRGNLIKEQALYDACKAGVVGGAGIDVWYQYPKENSGAVLPSGLPIHELDHVVLSPHQGGSGDLSEKLRIKELGKLLNELVEGRSVRHVDVEAGY